MESVDKWFENNCKYADGVAVYSNLPRRNANLLRLFKLKETAANLEKLKYELGKFRTIATSVQKVVPVNPIVPVAVNIEATAVATEKKQSLLFSQIPAELRPELLRANDLFRKNCYLKVTLNELPDNAENEALQLQTEISENFKENQLCWKKIDYWLEHRQLPKAAENDFASLTPAGLLRKQQLLYQNISKMQKRFEENSQLLSTTDDITAKAKLQRLVAKQDADLIKKNEELLIITKLIDGK
jgi:hypothetical protein